MAQRTCVRAGTRFGRLLVLADTWGWSQKVPCRCDCGAETQARSDLLRSGRQLSCGCWRREQTIARNTKHGKHGIPEYRAWKAMWDRCADRPQADHYRYYGARGITVCERWRSFENFYADMGPKPTPEHTLDRVDSNGNYEPGNCRWATWTEQSWNRRPFANSPKPRTMVACACGCGTLRETPDASGRDRRYVNGHNGRGPA